MKNILIGLVGMALFGLLMYGIGELTCWIFPPAPKGVPMIVIGLVICFGLLVVSVVAYNVGEFIGLFFGDD